MILVMPLASQIRIRVYCVYMFCSHVDAVIFTACALINKCVKSVYAMFLPLGMPLPLPINLGDFL